MNKTERKFWERVDMSGDCWEWQRATTGEGYGNLWIDGKNVRAHRYSYSLAHGPIPEGMCICHHCDNPVCVRPSHLFMGTNGDNIRDAFAKGKFDRRGEKNANSKLCADDVHKIRQLYSIGIPQSMLTKAWGISHPHINRIVHNKCWRHI